MSAYNRSMVGRMLQRGAVVGLVGLLGCGTPEDTGSVNPGDGGYTDGGAEDGGYDGGNTDGGSDGGSTLDLQVSKVVLQTVYPGVDVHTVEASNYDGDISCEFEWEKTVEGISVDDCTVTLDSSLFDTDYLPDFFGGSVTVSAEGYNDGYAAIDVDIGCDTECIVEEHAPVITTASLPNATSSQLYTFAIEATDADGDTLTYELGLDKPAWLDIDASGVLSGIPTTYGTENVEVIVTDSTGLGDSVGYNLEIDPYADVTVTVQTPDTKEAIVGAYVSLDCDNGEFLDGIVDALGEVTGSLSSETTCEIYADDDLSTPEHVAYLWDHDVSGGSNSVVAEIHTFYDPADVHAEYASDDCHNGLITDSRELLFYGTNLKHKTFGDSGERRFQRFAEGSLVDEGPITYWIDSESQYADEVAEAVATINGYGSDLGVTYLEASALADAQIMLQSGSLTSTACISDDDRIIGTYTTGRYCLINLNGATTRTVMEEFMNAVNDGPDLCGDSITSAGTSFTTNDFLIWDSVLLGEHQNLMERTYDL
jgi:hypothetical protein